MTDKHWFCPECDADNHKGQEECFSCGWSPTKTGPFRFETPDGMVAWGYRFPSGKIVMEWEQDSVPEGCEPFEEPHQSIYYSLDDLQTHKDGRNIHWGETP